MTPISLVYLVAWWCYERGISPEEFFVNGGFYLSALSLTWMMLEYGPTTLPRWGDGWLWPKQDR